MPSEDLPAAAVGQLKDRGVWPSRAPLQVHFALYEWLAVRWRLHLVPATLLFGKKGKSNHPEHARVHYAEDSSLRRTSPAPEHPSEAPPPDHGAVLSAKGTATSRTSAKPPPAPGRGRRPGLESGGSSRRRRRLDVAPDVDARAGELAPPRGRGRRGRRRRRRRRAAAGSASFVRLCGFMISGEVLKRAIYPLIVPSHPHDKIYSHDCQP